MKTRSKHTSATREQTQSLSLALQRYGVKALWYVVHINNLLSILKNGILCRNEVLRRNLKFKDISYLSVQKRRTEFHNYVPLFFADNTPMLYVCLQNDPERIVLLEIDVDVANLEGVIFSDGNVASNNSKIYKNSSDLAKLDWNTILNSDPAFYDEMKRKRSAELLIPNTVPSQYIRCIHVPESMSESKVKKLEKFLKEQLEIRVGARVYHPDFGLGRVIAIKDDGIVVVQFDNSEVGRKWLQNASLSLHYIVVDLTPKGVRR